MPIHYEAYFPSEVDVNVTNPAPKNDRDPGILQNPVPSWFQIPENAGAWSWGVRYEDQGSFEH